ncbi:helix-turn-helix transcriptional regulator [Nocardia cyriacigeorgica]|uniref:Helix-turn-helix transcriptional regulator n=1 Tax=Nocardia cyriacigeorgica TaxID=135487 RepID=A0A6P1CMF0_9NOCA|nr:helix-turn-helix transcriptional regulator [Nocardia cyriacigeorgica]MBF6424214.1 helix-turn-helix transcriptional regulator [Nocardia cyriacigeorgica]NEW33759.1 helix-turn-helix transcriptional regulator [Nocardia cyriacigeorgica]
MWGDSTNADLRSRRLARGWTQAELAELVCDEIEHATGRRPAVDAQAISRIECGEISWPRKETRRALASLFGVERESDLGLHPKRTRRDAERDEATKRRAFLALAGLAVQIPSELTPRRVGACDVDAMRQSFARLEDLDSYLGGADTFRLYITELSRTEQILRQANTALRVRTNLTELAAEQAQQAGWAAFDAGSTDTAMKLFHYSRRAAAEAESSELASNALMHIAYATGNTDSARAADAACAGIGLRAPAKARALLESRRAWSCAVAGDRGGAARALDIARAALDHADGEHPHWCSWVDDGEIDIMTGRVWSVLHRPDAATAPLERALANYPDHWARDKALYLTWLADAYLDAGDRERAVTTGMQALRLACRVASVRPLARVREVAQRSAVAGIDGGPEFARCAAEARVPIPPRL